MISIVKNMAVRIKKGIFMKDQYLSRSRLYIIVIFHPARWNINNGNHYTALLSFFRILLIYSKQLTLAVRDPRISSALSNYHMMLVTYFALQVGANQVNVIKVIISI